jgi:hypothetical protein
VRLFIALVVVWLIVGVAATVHRGYFKGNNATCAKTARSPSPSWRGFSTTSVSTRSSAATSRSRRSSGELVGAFPRRPSEPAGEIAELTLPDLGVPA